VRNKIILFDGGLEQVDLPAVTLNKGMILVKNSLIYLGFQDEALLEGGEPVLLPKTLGSVCGGRVIEAVDHPSLTGKFIITNPLVENSRSVLDVDGCLSQYFQVEARRVYRTSQSIEPVDLLEPYAAHATELAGFSRGGVVIVGCNIVGLMTALSLREKSVEPYMVCERRLIHARSLGLRVYKNPGDIPSDLDTLIIAEGRPFIWDIMERTSVSNIVVSGLSGLRSLRVLPPRQLNVTYIASITQSGGDVARKLAGRLLDFVKIAEVGSIEESLGYLPPRSQGVIIRISSP